MNDSITMTSTSQARTNASTLSSDAAFYTQLVSDLRNAQTQIQSNWEGDSTDINDIVTRIGTVCTEFETKIVPGLEQLSGGINTLADEIDAVSNQTVETDGSVVTQAGATVAGAEAATTTETKEEKGYWSYWGGEIAENWDYSQCDGLLDYVGQTVTALFGSGVDVVGAAWDGLTDVVGWFF